MGQSFSLTLGFCLGLGTACLLSSDVPSTVLSQRLISQGLANQALRSQAFSSPAFQKATTPWASVSSDTSSLGLTTVADGCLNNGLAAQLRGARPESISLLRHVPSLSQSLDWYSVTQRAAIASAPHSPAPKPAITHWPITPPTQLLSSQASDCPATAMETAAQAQPNRRPATAPIPQGYGSEFLVQQRSHFILSLVSLTQQHDWLLQPAQQPNQPIHAVWRSHEKLVAKTGFEDGTKVATAVRATAAQNKLPLFLRSVQ